mgnify:CR=1 FL=1
MGVKEKKGKSEVVDESASDVPEWMKEKKPEGRTKNIAPESKLKEPKWVNKPTEVSTEKKKK